MIGVTLKLSDFYEFVYKIYSREMSLHSWPERSKMAESEADTRSDILAGERCLRTRVPREKEGTKAEREISAFKS